MTVSVPPELIDLAVFAGKLLLVLLGYQIAMGIALLLMIKTDPKPEGHIARGALGMFAILSIPTLQFWADVYNHFEEPIRNVRESATTVRRWVRVIR